FETMNGSRNRRGNDLVRTVLESLTREQFEDIANRHQIVPVGYTPWVKGFTGGSDDHSGVFVAKGYTECPASHTPAEFLGHVAVGLGRPQGPDGTPLGFAHSLYGIGCQYYRDRFASNGSGARDAIVDVLGEIFGGEQARVGFRDRISAYARRVARRSDRPAEVEFKRTISTELVTLVSRDWQGDDVATSTERYHDVNRRTFELSS